MGKEARVLAELDDWSGEGKLLLETDELMFRGAKTLTIPLSTIQALSIDDGWLVVTYYGGTARFDLGDEFAGKWRHAIENPRQLIDKLDVKPTSRVLVAGPIDDAFIESVRNRTGAEPERNAGNAGPASMDLVFLYVNDAIEIDSIRALHSVIEKTGAIWVLHPKGRRETSHDAIMSIAKPLGLVDVKSAKYSETHGALKLMVPRSKRK
jgi:hypothetical protein